MDRSPFSPLLAVLGFGLPVMVFGAGNEPATQLPQFFVPGERVAALEVTVPRDDLRRPEPNFAADLLTIPGVYGHARAADAMEPNIRGLGLDRVATTFNGLPLVNASPERTNSPVAILGASDVTTLMVTKALPSVTLGPATTGGRISLTSDPGSPAPGGRLNTTFDGARDGITTSGRATAVMGAWDATGTVFRNDLNDYSMPNGRTVAARLSDYGGSAALGWHDDTQRARLEFLGRRLQRQDTVSLPLDGRNTDSQVVTFNDRWTPATASALVAIECRAGYATTDPYITSESRPSPPISAQANARSFGTGVTSTWRPIAAAALALGADFGRQSRRAVRTTAAGRDYIWPNAHYADAGVFAQWTQSLGAGCRIRAGARLDDVRSDASDADQPALGKPLRQQFASYNGADAAITGRHDQVGAANLLVKWNGTRVCSAFLGAGYSVQPAQVMERYRAFLNALGGDGHGGNAVELGNPALRAERKTAIEAGTALHATGVDLEATVYWYRVGDFITRTPIGITSPPLAHMVVFGYRNIDAEFFGGELGATFKAADAWTIPVTLAVANGRNRDTHLGLSEIPPVEATAAVRYHATLRRIPFAAELGGRLAARKTNPAPLENPLFGNTGGFAVWHLRTGFSPRPRIKLEAGIENLLDRAYSEYLSPPVGPIRPASGNLVPGERVPGPGRSLWGSVTLTW